MQLDKDEVIEGREEELRAEVARLQQASQVLAEGLERSTQALADSEARWRCLAKQSLTGIAIVEQTRFMFVNARFAEILGYLGDEMLTVPAADTVAHSSRLHVAQHIHRCLANEPRPAVLEYEGLRKDGSSVYLELSCSRLYVADGLRSMLMVSDISSRQNAEHRVHALERRLAELAVRDPLTGLYSRRFTEASLERELIQCERDNSPLSVVMCDIDDFKVVNDVFGRQAGDDTLKALGWLLKRRCRKSDLACRYGGEEFLMVFPGMPAEVAARWAERIRAALAASPVRRESSRVYRSAPPSGSPPIRSTESPGRS